MCSKVVLASAVLVATFAAAEAADLQDARQAFRDQNFRRVVEVLEAYLPEHPRDHRAWALRGRAHVELMAPDKALVDLNRAIELQPAKNGEDYVSRGRAYLGLRDFDKALADLNKAIEIDPQDAERYYYRGNVYSDRENHDAAFVEFHKAIELDPEYARAYVARGYTQWRRGTKYQTVTYRQGENTYQRLRFESVVDRELIDQGLADLARAIERAPDDPNAYHMRAGFHRELKDWPNYVADMKQLVRTLPKNPQLLNDLAWFLATIDDDRVRDGKTAVELAEEACALTRHEDPTKLDTLAAALAADRKFKRAAETQEKAIAKLGDVPPELKKAFEERRERYRRKQPLRFADPGSH